MEFCADGGLSLIVGPVDGVYVPFRGGRGGNGGGGGSLCATIRFCWFFFSSKPQSVAIEKAESINIERNIPAGL